MSPINYTPEEKEAMVTKARDWADSPEARASVAEITMKAEEIKKNLREARKIDPKKWNKPITI